MRIISSHIGISSTNLEKTICFFQKLIKAQVIIFNDNQGTATLRINDFEISIFTDEEFEGYDRNKCFSMHIGFEVDKKEDVDLIHGLAGTCGYKASKPFDRQDGDYSVFIEGPDKLNLECFYGGHYKALQKMSV